MPEHEKTSITLSFAKMLKISLFQADLTGETGCLNHPLAFVATNLPLRQDGLP